MDLERSINNKEVIHPLWLRFCHWINAFSVIVLITSGLRIYNASPLFDFAFYKQITLGGWVGGALQWHFAAMWLFVLNGCCYLLINAFTGRLRNKFSPIRLRDLTDELLQFLTGNLSHEETTKYNTLQKLAYLFVIVLSVLIVCSGLVLWKSIQFPNLSMLLGGYETARHIHFYSMALVVGFIIIHLIMVIFVPHTFIVMITGGTKTDERK